MAFHFICTCTVSLHLCYETRRRPFSNHLTMNGMIRYHFRKSVRMTSQKQHVTYGKHHQLVLQSIHNYYHVMLWLGYMPMCVCCLSMYNQPKRKVAFSRSSVFIFKEINSTLCYSRFLLVFTNHSGRQ